MDEMEGVIATVTGHLNDCTVGLYNIPGSLPSADIEMQCEMGGAACSRVFTITTVVRMESKLICKSAL